MSLIVNITNITGSSPYDIYICQSGGTGCFYITTITSVPYSFVIPEPYDMSDSYMLKIIDNNDCIISGVTSIDTPVTPTPTNTPSSTQNTTPTNTPTNTPTPTSIPVVPCPRPSGLEERYRINLFGFINSTCEGFNGIAMNPTGPIDFTPFTSISEACEGGVSPYRGVCPIFYCGLCEPSASINQFSAGGVESDFEVGSPVYNGFGTNCDLSQDGWYFTVPRSVVDDGFAEVKIWMCDNKEKIPVIKIENGYVIESGFCNCT
jgi:hypothetical protein